ncbi:MAG TPA: glycosyltransferase, partial [Acidobacteriaceae bacterium]
FAQSTLAHADIFAAACTLWALVYVLPEQARHPASTRAAASSAAPKNRIWPAAIWFSLAVLSKETAIIIPLSLAAFELGASFLQPRALRLRAWALVAVESACLLPLLAWYAYHRAKTGFLFGNPEFLRYNATSTMEPLRILAAFAHRLLHLFAHMNMFVPVLCTLAVLMLPPRQTGAGKTPPAIAFSIQTRIWFLILVNALEFSILGGALLTRYLLPVFPLVLFLCVSAFIRRSRYWLVFVTLSAAAFVAALFINPPYGFAPEDNLTYAHVIRLHQQAIHELNLHDKGASVLSAWPGTDELSRPELGYAAAPPAPPFDVIRIDDFSAPQIDRAAAESGSYSMAFVFSTKEEPGGLPFHIGGAAMEARYFGLHTDLRPDAIARRLHGEIIWQRNDGLQWAALLRFTHPVEAGLSPR